MEFCIRTRTLSYDSTIPTSYGVVVYATLIEPLEYTRERNNELLKLLKEVGMDSAMVVPVGPDKNRCRPTNNVQHLADVESVRDDLILLSATLFAVCYRSVLTLISKLQNHGYDVDVSESKRDYHWESEGVKVANDQEEDIYIMKVHKTRKFETYKYVISELLEARRKIGELESALRQNFVREIDLVSANKRIHELEYLASSAMNDDICSGSGENFD
jgi:hypothetical protein